MRSKPYLAIHLLKRHFHMPQIWWILHVLRQGFLRDQSRSSTGAKTVRPIGPDSRLCIVTDICGWAQRLNQAFIRNLSTVLPVIPLIPIHILGALRVPSGRITNEVGQIKWALSNRLRPGRSLEKTFRSYFREHWRFRFCAVRSHRAITYIAMASEFLAFRHVVLNQKRYCCHIQSSPKYRKLAKSHDAHIHPTIKTI